VGKRILSLDGLRGIAVLAVVIYHADLGVLNGGFLGVDVFFVLSGFLITTLLLKEVLDSGRIDRSDFYVRRIRRLLPALVLVLLFTIVITGLWVPDAAFGVRRDLPWALTFVLNWSYLFFEQSYFINIARPPLLQHLWSLAIEEQFYVIWPLVLIGLARIKVRFLSLRRIIFSVSILGAIASTLWMRHLSLVNGYPLPHDPSRVYFGTDTHIMSLLLGCAAAALWKPETYRSKLTPDRGTLLSLTGWVSVAFMVYCFTQVGELTPWLYRGGFLWLSLATATATLLATHPALRFGKILSFPVLTWFGERSYGIYLWHWPIFLLLRPSLDVAWPDLVTHVVRFGLVLLIAELSYRYVEMPIRNGILTQTLTAWKVRGIPRPTMPLALTAAAIASALTFAFTGVVTASTPSLGNSTAFGGITSIDEDPTVSPSSPATAKPKPSVSPSTAPILITATPKPTRSGVPTVFGDSVVLGSRLALQVVLGSVSIDAAVGRQPWEIADRIRIRRNEGRLGSDVVIHMGTNGLVRAEDLRPILKALRDRRRVVVVNVQVPRVWMNGSNDTIAAVTKEFPNVRLVNWHNVSAGHKGYFVPDGVHLTPIGGRIFAHLIEDALNAN
jgi:peptidoglycan/LPS O-acetylase OafA/YrhL